MTDSKEYRAPIVYGKSEMIVREKDIALLPAGHMFEEAVKIRELLKERGYSCTLVNARFVKPIDEDMIRELSKDHDWIVTLEENVQTGGFGERVQALPVGKICLSVYLSAHFRMNMSSMEMWISCGRRPEPAQNVWRQRLKRLSVRNRR